MQETTPELLHEGAYLIKSVTIFRPPHEVYNFWRNFENMPRFMRHVEDVKIISPTESHWIANFVRDRHVEWDAEIIGDRLNEMIGWRTVGDPDVDHAGSVWFHPVWNNQGTEVRVQMRYALPGGKVAHLLTKWLGKDPHVTISEDLWRLKVFLETGEVPTTEGQPSGFSQPYMAIHL